jgi:hypothetical protein
MARPSAPPVDAVTQSIIDALARLPEAERQAILDAARAAAESSTQD